nr:NADH dehydrogenase subunit 6 [Hyphessobrycon pulchripinnis]UEV65422.1 NADH dehydrogenase subunit 6 [Hyphessobrycon pulchripinnis]
MSPYLYVCFLGFVGGLVIVASNPTPHFAALGLVVAAAFGCGVLVGHGGSYLSLVLFLIYLGGMLVVFAFSTTLMMEFYVKGHKYWSSFINGAVYVFCLLVAMWHFKEDLFAPWLTTDEHGKYMLRADVAGVALLFSIGGMMMVSSGYGLLVALLCVMELTRGLCRGALRAI